jgi:hypothetical protein
MVRGFAANQVENDQPVSKVATEGLSFGDDGRCALGVAVLEDYG